MARDSQGRKPGAPHYGDPRSDAEIHATRDASGSTPGSGGAGGGGYGGQGYQAGVAPTPYSQRTPEATPSEPAPPAASGVGSSISYTPGTGYTETGAQGTFTSPTDPTGYPTEPTGNTITEPTPSGFNPSATGTAPTNPVVDQSAYATLLATLNDYGLGGLSDWLWGELQRATPESQIFLDLRKTDQYKARFPGLISRQGAGLPSMSEAAYIQTEEQYRQILRASGHTTGLTDPSTFTNFFTHDLNPEEVKARADLWDAITHSQLTGPRVKGLFEQFAGISNLSDEDLFKAMVEGDNANLQSLHFGMTSQGVQAGGENLSVNRLQELMKMAVQQEQATFLGGGGNVPGNRAQEGLLGIEQQQLV